MAEESADEWRKRVLEEAARMKKNLRDARVRRQELKAETQAHIEKSPAVETDELQKLANAQAALSRTSSRLKELKKESGLEDQDLTENQIKKLEIAEREMEATAKRISQLHVEVAETEDFDEEEEEISPIQEEESGITSSSSSSKPDPLMTESYMERAEDTWSRMERTTSMWKETQDAQEAREQDAPAPIAEAPEAIQEKVDGFVVPSKPGSKAPSSYDEILKGMELISSPLIFFNLACFQGTSEADIEVMHPICGYSVAGSLLCVMGPPGTDTSTLRVALSGMPQESSREVLVADFTVGGLMHVADQFIRKPEHDPKKTMIENLELQDAADVVIGTCIQRGARPDDLTAGTPRGARDPEMPTPRRSDAPTFPGSQAGLYKSVLLMEDLSTLLKAEEIFKVLRTLKKVAIGERASVLVTLNRPFERRGLLKMFDDILFFTEDGVCYYGPVSALNTFVTMIGSPCPHNIHITDHLGMVSNIAAKYHESPIQKHVQAMIQRFTGAPAQEDDKPVALTEKPDQASKRKSMPMIPRIKRKKRNKRAKEEQVPDALEHAEGGHARRLAAKLAEERRQMAEKQQAQEKEQIWQQLADLDAKGSEDLSAIGFEQMLLELQRSTKYNLPSCFMNLACFVNMEDPHPDLNLSAVQPTVAFASEGCLLGVLGPQGIDAGNLMSSLRFGSDLTTIITDLSVKDTLKMSEFVNSDMSDKEGADTSVEILMAKMMLTACSQEIVGTLIQRMKAKPEKTIEIGQKMLSTATRSILILDRILSLDAQSLFVVLKLIRRIAVPARLAVILLLDKPEEQRGLLPVLDNVLVFDYEGMFYFGAARHLEGYCSSIDMPKPKDVNIIDHIHNMMKEHPPSQYQPITPDNTATPYTTRYEYSALAKYNKRIVQISTKPQEQGGNMTTRTLLPKSFRRRQSKPDLTEETMEAAEMRRQKVQMARDAKKLRELEQKEVENKYEHALKQLAAANLKDMHDPLKHGMEAIVEEMRSVQSKPALFFNLASFMPDVVTDRVDILQPICGFAMTGRVVGLMGPQQTDLSAFVQALASTDPVTTSGMETPRGDTFHKTVTVGRLLTIAAESSLDVGEQAEVLDACTNTEVGTFLQRGLSAAEKQKAEAEGREVRNAQAIIVLDDVSSKLQPDEWFAMLSLIRNVAPQTDMTALVNMPKALERRGLFQLLDDVLVFDANGITYFGPARQFGNYLAYVGFAVPEGVHPTDHATALMELYSNDDDRRPLTDTAPGVRFKHSLINHYISEVAERYTGTGIGDGASEGSVDSEQGAKKKKKGLPFTPRRKTKKSQQKKSEDEEAAERRAAIAEAEAEAERQRRAEAEAESVWQELVEQSDP